MNEGQINLLAKRLIKETQEYAGIEPDAVKQKRDLKFCRKFFVQDRPDLTAIENLLGDAISSQNEHELDLLLMLLEHFDITCEYGSVLAPLLIQPWHHLHDRIASVLEFVADEATAECLYLGALYTCENLEYESDYRGFNRKCLYGLAKIGNDKAIEYILKVSKCDDSTVAEYAAEIMIKYSFD